MTYACPWKTWSERRARVGPWLSICLVMSVAEWRQQAGLKRELEQVRTIAANEQSNGRPLIEDRRFCERLAEIEVELIALESVLMQVLSDESAGRDPGPEASVIKIKGTEMQQAVAELKLDALGPYAHAYVPEALEHGWNEEPIGPDYAPTIAPQYFNWRKASIYGGSNEIQKNIIAKAVLGF